MWVVCELRPLFLPCALAAFATVVGAMPAPAQAAQRSATVTYVSPTRVKAGQTLVLRGRAFSARRVSNTIIFRGASGRVLLVKPLTSSARRLTVKVPRAIERLLSIGSSGFRRPTRVTIRIAVRKKFGKWTTATRSPIVVPRLTPGSSPPPGGGGPAGGTLPCGKGDDFDGDLLSNDLEASLDTDPCKADTDGDTVEDGFEYLLGPRSQPGCAALSGQAPLPQPARPE